MPINKKVQGHALSLQETQFALSDQMTDTKPSSPSLVSSTIDFDSRGFQSGHLRLPYSHDRSGYGFIPVPVAMLNEGEGPTLLLTGGNHGDEYEGPIALMKLMRRLPTLKVKGRVIVIPALNFPAVKNATRTSPIDGGNLNRAFPGKRNGTLTEMIAHYLETALFPITDVAFDLHAGGASTNYLPTLLAAWPTDDANQQKYTRLVHQIGAPRTLVMDLLGEDRTFAAAAERHKILFFCGEFGGHAVCSVDGLQVAEQSIDRLMVGLGMVEGAISIEGTSTFAVKGHKHYIFAPEEGVFEPAFRLGDIVKQGQLAGWVHNPSQPLRTATEVKFEGDGMVICIRALAACQEGDCLGHLASPVSL